MEGYTEKNSRSVESYPMLVLRIHNLETEIRELHGKVSVLENRVSDLMADRPDGRVTDDDQPEFDWEDGQ